MPTAALKTRLDMKRFSDEKWMSLALSLAERGRYNVSPNPLVGCVIVRNGKLIASGYHRYYGGDHAEVAALKKAGFRSRGATMYVTLEPCSTFGKTPPCVDALLKAGIRRVVVAATDPNPRHGGAGLRLLRRKGVSIKTGVLKSAALTQNEAFFYFISNKLPFVTLKMAQSLDGKIAAHTGRSRWISSTASRKFVHELRLNSDAVMVGKNTALRDNPSLDVRFARRGRQKKDRDKPWRVVLDPQMKLKSSAKVFSGSQTTLQVVSEKALRNKKISGRKGRIILPVREVRGKLDVRDVCRKLASLGVARLLVEGGGELAWSLFEKNLIRRAIWIVAPKVIGGRTARTSVEGEGCPDPNHAIGAKSCEVRKLDNDIIMDARF